MFVSSIILRMLVLQHKTPFSPHFTFKLGYGKIFTSLKPHAVRLELPCPVDVRVAGPQVNCDGIRPRPSKSRERHNDDKNLTKIMIEKPRSKEL